MANRAYVSAWAEDYSEDTKLERFARLLETVPLSQDRPGFTDLVVRAVDVAETPVREWDLRGRQFLSSEIIDLLREHRGSDIAYELGALWDLWSYDTPSAGAASGARRWVHAPHKLEILCYGEDFDGGIAVDDGHFLINAGFEHLFTGHARLLGTRSQDASPGCASADPSAFHGEEAAFLAEMRDPTHLRAYQDKTRENIQALLRWLRRAEAAVPLERYRLWSEGELDLEARLDEILAIR
jgi:hypothetical protein